MTRLTLNAILFLTLLTNSVVANAAADAERVAATVEQLRQSINAHDYGQLEPSLDADFTYQGRDAGLSKMIMQQVIAGYPNELTAITVLSMSANNNTWEVAVRLESPGQMEQRNIRLSQDYRLLQADIVDIQLAGHGQPSQEPQATASTADLPAVTTVPFELVKKIIQVQAEINGVAGNYLVDTGAQSVVLNKTHFEPGVLKTVVMDHAPPSGVGGVIQDVLGVVDLELTWGAIQIDGFRGMVMDLSHLETSLGTSITGVIGYNVLERFQIYFDYAAQELTLYSLDENLEPLQESDLGRPELITSFEMVGHIPVFPVQIAGYELQMGLDSGAAGAMLFERWQATLDGQYEFIERTELRGGDKNVQMGDVVRISSMRLQDIDYADMTFRFNDMAAHNGNTMPFDGLLGYEFLMTRPTAINFRARQLLIWPRSVARSK